ncbi:hypothetical protein [Radiobacillus sp. PE A8.2]|uniref:hypothetical protein n=1 Tax=Radiobacillus sp. PE A8.2 TaxID=3380349 RepID=UPI0038905B55
MERIPKTTSSQTYLQILHHTDHNTIDVKTQKLWNQKMNSIISENELAVFSEACYHETVVGTFFSGLLAFSLINRK